MAVTQLSSVGCSMPAEKSNTLIEAWFDRLPQAIFIADHDQLILDANAAGQSLRDSNLLIRKEPHLRFHNRDGQQAFESCLLQTQRLPGDTRSFIVRGSEGWNYATLYTLRDMIFLEIEVIDPDSVLDLEPVARFFGLTGGEIRVLHGVSQSFGAKEIANALDISVHTVRAHLRSIYAKFGAKTASQVQSTVLKLSSMKVRDIIKIN